MSGKNIYRTVFILFIVVVNHATCSAQNGSFTVQAGADKIGVTDQMEVTYTIRDIPNVRTLDPVPFRDFAVVQGPMQFTQSNTTLNGNQAVQSTSLQITYVVKPRHTGHLVIPAAIARFADGKGVQSNSLTIDVVPGSVVAHQQRRRQANPFGEEDEDPLAGMQRQIAQQRALMQRMMAAQGGAQQAPQPQQHNQPAAAATDLGKDMFIKVDVDKSKVNIGQQITASYKLYARIPMQVGISKLPSLNGFWLQDFDIPKQAKPTLEVVNGQRYQVFLLKKSALFPQQSGTLVLDPAEAQGTARVMRKTQQRNGLGDMFENDPFFQQAFGGSLMMNDPMFNDNAFGGYSYEEVPVHLKSQPLNITVTPLPEKGRPTDYSGAVGSFSIQEKIDKTMLSTDDAATLQLTVSGTGNFKLITAPKLNLPSALDSYEPKITDTITGRSTAISGSKIISYSIAPRTPGDYTIPPVSFSYYNPETGAYTILHTQPQRLHVTAGAHYKPAAAVSTLHDLHGNETVIPSFATAGKPFIYSPGYWSLYALPLLTFLGFIIWRKRSEESSQDTPHNRIRKANRVALRRLTTAQQYLQQGKHTPFYDEVSKALWLYLSDKLQLPLAHLSKESMMQSLGSRQVPFDTLKKLDALLQHCEVALYTPAGGAEGMGHTYDEAIGIISNMETYI